MASAVTNISENRIAASIPSKSTGSMVTSAAISGVLHISRKEYLFLISQYSFIKRPAWRIIHTGGRSAGSENAAFINNEFVIYIIRGASLAIAHFICSPFTVNVKKGDHKGRPYVCFFNSS